MQLAFHGLGALRHDHDAEPAAGLIPLPDLVQHLAHLEGDFRDEDDIRGGGDAAVERDEAGISPHQLDDHDAFVTLRRRVQLVDRLGRGADRGVKPERGDGSHHVIVDRLGDPDDRQALLPEIMRDRETAIASDRDQGIETARIEGVDQVIRAVHLDFLPARILGRPSERDSPGWWYRGSCLPGG